MAAGASTARAASGSTPDCMLRVSPATRSLARGRVKPPDQGAAYQRPCRVDWRNNRLRFASPLVPMYEKKNSGIP